MHTIKKPTTNTNHKMTNLISLSQGSQVELLVYGSDFTLSVDVTYDSYQEYDEGGWFQNQVDIKEVTITKWDGDGNEELPVTEADRKLAQEVVDSEAEDAFDQPTLEHWL